MKELEAFEAWWSAQETGLGTAHKFTAWNAWLARAAVEADRAQRVPDGWLNVLEDFEKKERSPFQAYLADGLANELRAALLASTPAQPSQQEKSKVISKFTDAVFDLAKDLAGIPPDQPVERKPMVDPCPGCAKGHVCRTPKCGRLALPVDHPLRCPTPGIKE